MDETIKSRINLIIEKIEKCGSNEVRKDIFSSEFYKKYKSEIDSSFKEKFGEESFSRYIENV